MNYFLFYLFNSLYKPAYLIYKPAYFIYKSLFEKEHLKVLEENIKPGMIVLDIGANIGFYTIKLAKLVGKNGHVYAFEPDKLNYLRLKENVKNLSNVSIYQKAVGEKDGKIKLYYSKSLNVDHQTYDIGENRNYSEVSVVAIDQFLKISKIDVVKIDIQGFDFFALKGMEKLLKKSKKVLYLGELWPYGLLKSGVKPQEYLILLRKMKFKIKFFDQKYSGRKQDLNKNLYFDFYAIKDK